MAGEATPISAPVSAAPAAAAPVAAPVTETATATPVAPNPGESTLDFFKRGTPAANPDIPEVSAEPAPEAPPAEPVTPVVPDKPADAPPEGAKPEPVKEDAPASEDEPLSLEPEEVISPRDLAAKLTPEVLAALEAAGIDKNQMFATARIATKGAKVLELFNGDVETAQYAHDQAEQFNTLSEGFTNQRTPEDTRSLLGEMMKLSYVLDDDGNPVIDKTTGQPQSDGTVGVFLDNTFQIGLDYWAQQAEHSDNPDLKAAIEVLKEAMDSRSGSASAKDYSNLDAETKARLEAVDAREKEQANREATARATASQEFETKVGTSIESKVTSEVEGLLKNAALTDGQRKWAIDQIKERTIEKLKGSKVFFNKLDALMRRPASEKTLQARTAHGINSARPLLPAVARQVLEELGVQYGTTQKAATQKLATQQQASRSEVKSASARVTPASVPNAAELQKQVTEEFVAAHGREPKTHELMAGFTAKRAKLGIA